MRDVNAGWLLRYAHANGASFFFIVTYIHIFRGLYYGIYKAPRELVWMLGLVIYLLMMATAFMGYVLPWGQMSYWGAQVITGFFCAIPAGRRADPRVAARRLRARPGGADPLLLAPLSAAVRDRRRGHPPHLGAAHSRARATRPASTSRPRRTRCRSIPSTPPRTAGSPALFLIALSRGAVLRAQRSRPRRTITSRPTRSRRRRTSSPNGISGRSTRSCAPSRSTSSCRPSCGACWRCSPRSCCCSSCRGSTARRSARAITGRCSSASSGSWCSTCWCSAGAAARRPTPLVCRDQPDRLGLLFRALPDHPAAHLEVRAAAAAAVFDLGVGAARREAGKRSVRARQERARGGRIRD